VESVARSVSGGINHAKARDESVEAVEQSKGRAPALALLLETQADKEWTASLVLLSLHSRASSLQFKEPVRCVVPIPPNCTLISKDRIQIAHRSARAA
jgi:hypothetical protein